MIQCQCVENKFQPSCSPGNSTSNGRCTSWCIGSARTRSITKAGISSIHETTGAARFSHRFRYTKSENIAGNSRFRSQCCYTDLYHVVIRFTKPLPKLPTWNAMLNSFIVAPEASQQIRQMKDFLKPLSGFWKILSQTVKGNFVETIDITPGSTNISKDISTILMIFSRGKY